MKASRGKGEAGGLKKEKGRRKREEEAQKHTV